MYIIDPMSDKQVGYILLGVGIAVMIFAGAQIILVFTGKATPIEVFSYNQSGGEMKGILDQMQRTAQAQAGASSSTMPNIIDPVALNKILNLTVYYVVMQFVFGIGYKLSTLGTQLIRPIVVQVKNKKLESVVAEEEKQS